ncbi:MAG: hypothetical protein ACFFHD_14065 [Promethearchaeota archaeon]
MSKKIKYAYCKVCKREVEHSVRKPMTTSQKISWIIGIVATLGIAIIFLVIIQSKKPKNYCPDCFSKLKYSDEPFEKPKKEPEEMTPKERLLDKAGVEEELKEKPKKKKIKLKESKEEKKIFCPYCGEELEEKLPTCPFCQSVLEF